MISKFNFTFVLMFIAFTSAKSFAAISCGDLFHTNEVIEGEIINEIAPIQEAATKNQITVQDSRSEKELMDERTKNFNDYVALQKSLYYKAKTNDNFIDPAKNTTEIKDDEFKNLRKFHLYPGIGLTGSTDHHVMIRTKLSYVGTESKLNNKKKPIKIHKYLKVVSEKLKIYGILVEEQTEKGSRMTKFFVRFSEENKKGISNIDFPLGYMNSSRYEVIAGKYNDMIDEGLMLSFVGRIILSGEKKKSDNAGIKAEVSSSARAYNPKDSLEVSLYIVKQ